MSLMENAYSVLVVSASDSFNTALSELLSEARFSPVRFENSITTAKHTLAERNYDIVIINSPLPDDTGIRFAIDLGDLKSTVAMIFVRAELYAGVYDKVVGHGIYTIARPTSKTVIETALDWMIATRERLKKFEKKTLSTEEKMMEIRTVNRAKWLLIEKEHMTEQEAHRYIEKRAMDLCVSKGSIAEEIIRTYP